MSIGNEPAYPAPEQIGPNDYYRYAAPGLTKRELFAAMAMQGCIANGEELPPMSYIRKRLGLAADMEFDFAIHTPAFVAKVSVDYADALLAQLSKAPQP